MTAEDITELDKNIIRVLQGDFPLVAEPYKTLAEQAGVSEEVFLERIRDMQATKKIRKMGAVLRHREVGFSANVLVAWEVPAARLDEIAQNMAKSPSVTHCYDRNTAPDWPYNLYTMVHGHSREECEQVVKQLGEANGVSKHVMLYSKHEWKKTAMKYFCE
ncbi:MAG: Lrp/AsnC family transcriptional regulator [Selenomonas sp.]|uniref:siroheme decarboxylase subunit beta n=1 Tax=Selenomonas sp. AE3005 TaxID=1485543 RepID=UPI0025E5BCAA|nr:AsnC family transcriptional regulator [Selenomonas sp. AE3005]MBQ1462134.1 Lrp/AsnC family transcriptional regulator [Selenomonas sp.]MBQ1808159.1 Lrp/AsnC family transcriptional regulator [Selenomonas sp.]MBQ1920228.1 Lrp/AsnC family transcriptional regulator [Selenomonas sp.]